MRAATFFVCLGLGFASVPGVSARAGAAGAPRFDPDRKALDALYGPLDRPGAAGGVVYVAKGGKPVYEKAFGLANVEHSVRNTRDTVFKISYGESREFTAMTVAMLARKGVLSLDDSLRKHMPELPPYADAIRLRHLIHHASGLPDYGALFLLTGWRLFNPLSDGEFLRLLGRLERTDFAPGTDYMYSNTDYALLAFVVQRATGESLREVAATELFAPFGMAATRIDDQYARVVLKRAYAYYDLHEETYLVRREKTSPAGRNGVLTTVGDLARWAAALDDPGSRVARAASLLREGARFAPTRPGAYVFGHFTGKYRGVDVVRHQGIDGDVYLVRVPDHDMVVALLTNGPADTERLVDRTLDALLFDTPGPSHAKSGAPAEKLARWEALRAAHPKGIAISAAERQRYAGRYDRAVDPRGNDAFDIRVEGDALVGHYGEIRDPIYALASNVLLYVCCYLERAPLREGEPVRLTAYRITTGEHVADFASQPPPPALDAKDRAALPGRYYNHELDVTWQLLAEDGKLLLRRERMLDATLVPKAIDRFALEVLADVEAYVFGMEVRIDRDGDGNPNGLTVVHDRIRGLRFDRME